MVPFERAIRFEEVDAAGIVFFARFVTYAHEAMEHLFDAIDGGYAGLIVSRRVGLPAVKVEMSFAAPLRYGDRLRIETTVTHLGNRSATLRYRMVRMSDAVAAAEILHTVVTTDLVTLRSCPMPPDVRARLLEHLEAAARTPPAVPDAPPPTERAP